MSAEPARHQAFDHGRRRAGLSVEQLWLDYLALGGRHDRFDVEAFVHGLAVLPAHEQNVLAHAINEELTEIYLSARVPYLIDPDPEPAAGAVDPLALLAELLHQPDQPETEGRPEPTG